MKALSDNAYFEFLPIKENENEGLYETICSESEYTADLGNTTTDDIVPKKDCHNMMLQSVYNKSPDKNMQWKKGTPLIIGDSLIHGIDESRLKNTEVRMFPGAFVENMQFNIIPLLRKNPANIIIHVGTNNTRFDSSAQIINKLTKLKYRILIEIPNCTVIYSQLVNRFDDAKAQLTIIKTNELIKNIGTCIVDYSNITKRHLGKKG